MIVASNIGIVAIAKDLLIFMSFNGFIINDWILNILAELVGQYHSFAVNLSAVGDEGVDVHAGLEGRGIDDGRDASALCEVDAAHLLALEVIDTQESVADTLGKGAFNRGGDVEGIRAVLHQRDLLGLHAADGSEIGRAHV